MKKLIKVISVLLLLITLLSCKKDKNDDLIKVNNNDTIVGTEKDTLQKDNNELYLTNFNNGFDPSMEVFNAKLVGNSENKACYFDGSGDYIKLNIPSLNNDSSFSVSLWVAPISYGTAAAWLSKSNTNNSKSQWRMGLGWPAEKKLNVTFYSDNWEDHFCYYSIPLFQWTHIVYNISPDLRIAECYINGEKKSQWNINGYKSSIDPVYLGLQLDDYFYYNGLIDELKFFRDTLSQERVGELYNEFMIASKVEIDTSNYILNGGDYSYSQPVEINDGIETGSIDTSLINMDKLTASIQKILNNETENIKSLLVYKDDKLILEEYFKGHTITDLNGLASVTKSFTSSILGIAIDKGYVKSVDEKLTSFFPVTNSNNSCVEDIQISHLLDQISGLRPKEIDADINNSIDWGISILEKHENCELGKFIYNEVNPDMIQHIINTSTQIDPFSFAKQYLFDPLQINNYTWPNGNSGVLTGGTGLAISSRDMLKLGIVHLNKGMFNGKRVFSEEWANNIIGADNSTSNYKNFWWIGNSNINGNETPYVSASGFGDQYIRIFPELNIIVVVTTSPQGSGIKPLSLINNEIIPALLNAE